MFHLGEATAFFGVLPEGENLRPARLDDASEGFPSMAHDLSRTRYPGSRVGVRSTV